MSLENTDPIHLEDIPVRKFTYIPFNQHILSPLRREGRGKGREGKKEERERERQGG